MSPKQKKRAEQFQKIQAIRDYRCDLDCDYATGRDLTGSWHATSLKQGKNTAGSPQFKTQQFRRSLVEEKKAKE